MKDLAAFVAFLVWMAGVVVAAGFWQTFAALIFPPYAWYLVVEVVVKRWLVG